MQKEEEGAQHMRMQSYKDGGDVSKYGYWGEDVIWSGAP